MRRVRPFLSVLVLLASLLTAAAIPAASAAQSGLPDLDQIDPERFSYEDALTGFEQVTTRTGAQIWLDYIRPDTDEPVPTILISSPYYNTLGRGWRAELKEPHQGPSFPTSPGVPFLATGEPVPYPEWYDEYFVPRGYAVVLMDLRGTRNSSGCQVYGDRDEVFDTVDVIDWIAEQDWSNGKVGMTGGSYDGTIAIGAAAEAPISGKHPEALSAIIPIRAIGRWYDYHWFNGVQSQGHASTAPLFTAALAGADTQNSGTDDLLLPLHFTERKACIATIGAAVDAGYVQPYQDADAPFWAERDFIKDFEGLHAATFVISGLFDFNVKNNNTGYVWENLPPGLPSKLWFMNGDHVDPHVPTPEDADAGGHVMPFPFQDRYIEWTHRWYLQFLKGVEAGALEGPKVEAQRADGSWGASDTYPVPSQDLALSLTPDGALVPGAAEEGGVTYRDAPTGATDATFVTAPFDADTHISGQFAFDLLAEIDGPDTTVAATIVALPPGIEPGGGSTDLHNGDTEEALQVSYAWIRAWYRESVPLRGISTPHDGGPLTSGEQARLQFGSLYTDVIIPAGWRLAVTFSNNEGGTVPSLVGGNVQLLTGPDASRMLLPVVQGAGGGTSGTSSTSGTTTAGTTTTTGTTTGTDGTGTTGSDTTGGATDGTATAGTTGGALPETGGGLAALALGLVAAAGLVSRRHRPRAD